MLLCTVELLFSRNHLLTSTYCLRFKPNLINAHSIVYMCTVYMHVCKKGHVTTMFAHDPFSSSTYPMIIHTHHVASNLPKKT